MAITLIPNIISWIPVPPRIGETNFGILMNTFHTAEKDFGAELDTTIDDINISIGEMNTDIAGVNSDAAAAAASAAAALVSETNAGLSETAASGSETAAGLSETAASGSETAALASENKAQKWSEELEDVEVETGKYSSYHWSEKAKENSGFDSSSFVQHTHLNETGILTGGEPSLNVDITKIDIEATTYYIQGVKYSYIGITGLAPSFGVGETARRIGLDALGLVEQAGSFTNIQKQTILPICRVNTIQGQSGAGSNMLDPLHQHYQISESGYLDRIWHEEAIGILYYSGGVISESSTARQINESAGIFYNAQRERMAISGTSNIAAKAVYHISGTWSVATEATLVVDNAQYDNGTDLTTLSNNKWVSHTLLKAPKEQDQFFLVYSQAEYASQAEAEAVAVDYGVFQNQATSGLIAVAKIIIQQGITNINQIVDYRPFIGGNVGSTLGTGTLQQTYENSSTPEFDLDLARGAITAKIGADMADTDNVWEGKNQAGTTTFSVDGNGKVNLKEVIKDDSFSYPDGFIYSFHNHLNDTTNSPFTSDMVGLTVTLVGSEADGTYEITAYTSATDITMGAYPTNLGASSGIAYTVNDITDIVKIGGSNEVELHGDSIFEGGVPLSSKYTKAKGALSAYTTDSTLSGIIDWDTIEDNSFGGDASFSAGRFINLSGVSKKYQVSGFINAWSELYTSNILMLVDGSPFKVIWSPVPTGAKTVIWTLSVTLNADSYIELSTGATWTINATSFESQITITEL